jgi:hypothetical protein
MLIAFKTWGYSRGQLMLCATWQTLGATPEGYYVLKKKERKPGGDAENPPKK